MAKKPYPRDEDGDEICIGELVFYEGLVWRVEEIESILGGFHLTLRNTRGVRDKVIPQKTTWLGQDHISGLDKKRSKKRQAESGDLVDSRGDPVGFCTNVQPLFPWEGRFRGAEKPREPEKVDTISHADLISQESRRLQREEAGEQEPPKAPRLKGRKGEW